MGKTWRYCSSGRWCPPFGGLAPRPVGAAQVTWTCARPDFGSVVTRPRPGAPDLWSVKGHRPGSLLLVRLFRGGGLVGHGPLRVSAAKVENGPVGLSPIGVPHLSREVPGLVHLTPQLEVGEGAVGQLVQQAPDP